MARKTEQLEQLMKGWREKHLRQGHKRFIEDGLVCEESWQQQKTPRVCFFLKEAYTEEADGYNLTQSLHQYGPWKMWKKVAIWTQAIYNAFEGGREYDVDLMRAKERAVIDSIAVVNVKKSDGDKASNEDDLKKYAEEDKEEIKRELEIIQPDIIVCGNNFGLLKIVLENDGLECDDTWDTMLAKWHNTLVIDYYHPAVQYANRVNYYALMGLCRTAIDKYNLDFSK